MARVKTKPQNPVLLVRSHTLTRETHNVLKQLSQEASDRLGWTVSSSALVRALIRHAGQQPAAWAPIALHPLIEQEILAGRVWGKKRQ